MREETHPSSQLSCLPQFHFRSHPHNLFHLQQQMCPCHHQLYLHLHLTPVGFVHVHFYCLFLSSSSQLSGWPVLLHGEIWFSCCLPFQGAPWIKLELIYYIWGLSSSTDIVVWKKLWWQKSPPCVEEMANMFMLKLFQKVIQHFEIIVVTWWLGSKITVTIVRIIWVKRLLLHSSADMQEFIAFLSQYDLSDF